MDPMREEDRDENQGRDSEPAKFEEALAELERIVRKMEEGELTLDESLEAFERGIRLARFCRRKLDSAERRVELLLKDEEGNLKSEPFRSEPVEPG